MQGDRPQGETSSSLCYPTNKLTPGANNNKAWSALMSHVHEVKAHCCKYKAKVIVKATEKNIFEETEKYFPIKMFTVISISSLTLNFALNTQWWGVNFQTYFSLFLQKTQMIKRITYPAP